MKLKIKIKIKSKVFYHVKSENIITMKQPQPVRLASEKTLQYYILYLFLNNNI